MKAYITFDSGCWNAKDGVGPISQEWDDDGKHGSGRVRLFETLRERGYTIAVIDGEELKLIAVETPKTPGA